MNVLKIQLRVDSRDEHAHLHFGSTTDFPDEINFDDPNIPEEIQPIGNVECTAYSAVYIAQNKTKQKYDIDELFSRIPHTAAGADPRDMLNEVVKRGFLIKGTTTYDKPYSSYFRADTGPLSPFNNVRSAMILAQSPAIIWTNWYINWINLQPNAIISLGTTPISGHCYADKGWGTVTPITINGEPMFTIEWWGGYTIRMSAATFNDAISKLGCGAAILSDKVLDTKRTKTIYQSILDAIQNVLLLFQRQVIQLPTPNINTVPPVLDPDLQPIVSPSKGQQIYAKAMSLKGQYLTLDTSVPKTFNCAECMSYIFQQCGYAMPEKGYPGTISIESWLEKNFQEIPQPELYCVVNAITQGQNHGHIAINGHEAMLSNDSQTGTLESYWTLAGFQNFYGTQKGLTIKYFRPL